MTVIASNGAAVPSFEPVMPRIGLEDTFRRSCAGFRPAFAAAWRIVASFAIRYDESPSTVETLVIGLACPGPSGWPRYTSEVAFHSLPPPTATSSPMIAPTTRPMTGSHQRAIAERQTRPRSISCSASRSRLRSRLSVEAALIAAPP